MEASLVAVMIASFAALGVLALTGVRRLMAVPAEATVTADRSGESRRRGSAG